MIDYRNIIKNRELRLKLINLLRIIPTKPYLRMVFRIKTGHKLHLNKPVGFNDKLNWLKIHDIHPEYSQLVDKLEVQNYIREQLGESYLFPTLGVWDRFEDIDFDSLPEKFVLKCTHDSGSTKIVQKNLCDYDELKSFFSGRLKINAYVLGREYPYKYVKPRIIAEEFMSAKDGNAPNDYKFFCFNGEPKILYVATERSTDCKFTFFDMDFNHLPIVNTHANSTKIIEKPLCFEEMKEISKKLSKGKRFVRIDLYEINGKVYFGEFTFFHVGGFYLFNPPEWERKLGDMLVLD